ncbi:MAG TPA: beta-ketoacyl-ACP synthase II [Candidatus Solibacter sp.]|jgi:3-oxoacyl-[acyl-carrier-protein] synthase II|nr:beta-ketoacyl-ACP synthase II [Candidatus Solibacter sp.]
MNGVVVTGMGCVSPVGNDVPATWKAMVEGRSGIGRITQFDSAELPVHVAGEVTDFDAADRLGPKQARRMSRFSQFAVVVSEEALSDAGLDLAQTDRDRVGVLIASGVGGLREIEQANHILENQGHRRVSPFVVPMMIGDMASGNVAIRFDLRGPNFGLVSACASGAHAIGEAAEIIRRGDADVMIAGGSEAAITPLAVASFVAARALSESDAEPETVSRPFDRDRSGFVIAEGAAVVILESEAHARARGARVLAVVAGYGAGADAYHMTAPEPSGRGAIASMRKALVRAGLEPAELGYLNAHGTSTDLNDRAEAAAIHQVFNSHTDTLPVSSTKSMTGHLLGAAGALESVVCVKAIETGMIPATINLDNPSDDCRLDHVTGSPRAVEVRSALNNSFGFGGHNASLVFTSADA